MIECLSEIGIDDKDLQIISKLYWEQSACVRTESGMSSEFKIKKGVRQGCVLSPNIFNLYTEKIFREVEDMKGINIGGVYINNLRYADDTVLLAEDPMFLQALLTAVNEKGKPYGMEMNIIKTKSMVISRKSQRLKLVSVWKGNQSNKWTEWCTLVIWQRKMENVTKKLKEE